MQFSPEYALKKVQQWFSKRYPKICFVKNAGNPKIFFVKIVGNPKILHYLTSFSNPKKQPFAHHDILEQIPDKSRGKYGQNITIQKHFPTSKTDLSTNFNNPFKVVHRY